jgi:ubiquinone/menaquinone biosynthesis C-methylase UbiE
VDAVKSRLARGYSRTAPLYDALAGHLYATGVRRLLPRLRMVPMPAILDVGSGTGINLIEAARWFGPTQLLCGIDISPGMVEVARTKAATLGLPAQFVAGDAEQLPYPNGLFDIVINNSVFHWFADKNRALSEMRRVLRPGGQLILICASTPAFAEWFSLVDRVAQGIVGPTDSTATPILPTAAEVVGLLQSHGFLLEHVATPVKRERVHNPVSFVRLMSTVAPHWTADLTPAAAAQTEQAVLALMRRAGPFGFSTTWAAVEAVGTRLM